MYETDTEQVCVKLTYLTEVDRTTMSGFPSPQNIRDITVYSERVDGLENCMRWAGDLVAEEVDPGFTYTVTPYESSSLPMGMAPTSMLASKEEKGYTLTMAGTKEAIDDVITELGDSGYGLPERNAWVADWNHPIRSVKGTRHAANTIESLTDFYLPQERSTRESTPEWVTFRREVTFAQDRVPLSKAQE